MIEMQIETKASRGNCQIKLLVDTQDSVLHHWVIGIWIIMGQGGIIVLVNGTKYAWDRTGSDNHQKGWDFGNDQAKFVETCK